MAPGYREEEPCYRGDRHGQRRSWLRGGHFLNTNLEYEDTKVGTCVLPRDMYEALTRHIGRPPKPPPEVRHPVRGVLNPEPPPASIDPRHALQVRVESDHRHDMLRPAARHGNGVVPRRGPRRLLHREPRLPRLLLGALRLGLELRRAGGATRRVRGAAAAILNPRCDEDALALVALAVAAVVEASAAEGFRVIALRANGVLDGPC